jgi:predicted nucleic acid-binding protein
MASTAVLLDTGPLVAALSRDDGAHVWAKEQFNSLEGPFLTCEPIISEACHLLRRSRGGPGTVLALLDSGALRIGMDLTSELSAIRKLLEKYRNVPASLADACLVRMSEIYDACLVLTFDSDFHVYRRHGRKVIPVLSRLP